MGLDIGGKTHSKNKEGGKPEPPVDPNKKPLDSLKVQAIMGRLLGLYVVGFSSSPIFASLLAGMLATIAIFRTHDFSQEEVPRTASFVIIAVAKSIYVSFAVSVFDM